MRVDSASLIPGSIVCGDRGLGVLGSTILANTSTGDHGPGYLYNDVDTGDEGKEFRGLIVTPPSAGTFFAYEDGSFSFTAPDGTYTFVYRLYVDGVDLGTATSSVTIGGAATASLSVTTAASVFAGSATVSPVASITATTDPALFSGSAGVGVFADLSIATDAALFAGAAVVSPVSVMDAYFDDAAFSGSASSSPGIAVYPLPAQVLLGVTYGPTGADFTGTATGGAGPSASDIAAAVWGYTQ